MLNLLKQSEGTIVKAGPLLDSYDASPETGLTPEIYISKNGGALTLSAATATHDAMGHYSVSLTEADTDTRGRLRMVLYASGALSCWEDYIVVPANVYNSFIAGTATLLDGDSAGVPTTLTMKNSSGDGVQGCQVWVTSDGAGLNRITRVATTDANGAVRFLLQDGVVYYLWCDSPGGLNDIEGQSFTAQADE